MASKNGSQEADFDNWCEGILHLLKAPEQTASSKSDGGCANGNNCCSKKKSKKSGKGKKKEQENEAIYDSTSSMDDMDEPVLDLEDLGGLVANSEKENDVEDDNLSETGEIREMLTPQLRESLTKQGYRLIGTHSGVKLCRWTKVCTWRLFSLKNSCSHFLNFRQC